MSKLFPTCLLTQEGSNAPELLTAEVRLYPGSTLSPDQGKTVLLAGGYALIAPDSTFPLSSTLQLNYDLATFSQQQLESIATAELTRLYEVNYRSYTVEADNRVCVIGDSAEALLRFMDTYGGILDIDPLLLKGYHPEIPTVTELNLDAHGRGCRLGYQVRSPIDLELCTYCGACGPACPEQCISETLFLNYDACTFCKECEGVCEAKAIDIHSAISSVLEVPAVIILGDVQVDLPENTNCVYYEKNLPEYFATLFPCQIDEVITCDNSICQYSGRLGRGCDLCLSSCRYGAISQGENGVAVDSLKCEECGSCVAACPTGALQNERFNDKSFVNYFQQVAIPLDGTVVIGDENSLHAMWWQQKGRKLENIFYLQYDKVRSLSLFHCLYLLSRGARRLVFLEGREQNFTKSTFGRQIDLAGELVNRLYDIDDAFTICRLQDFDAMMAGSCSGSFGPVVEDKEFVNRRRTVATALEAMASRSGREVVMSPEGYIPFATVACDRERCTQCMACLNDCRIEAMSAAEDQLALRHEGAMCVGCGLCVRICPEDALKISSEFTLSKEFFAPAEMAKAEPMACKSCGKVFGTRKSFERVMSILSKKETVDTSHFEYCETCRVVNLFESE
jgi:ferredoxin